MRYHVLVTDYDQTIAEHGIVADETIRALEKVRESGRRIVLVTGRQFEDLLRLPVRMDLFDRVVAENGAVLYRPDTREFRLLSEPPAEEFARALADAGIAPLSEGHVIVATVRPNETAILQIIRDLGLELQVIFNHSAVMILPSGTNKASGLQEALMEMGFSAHNSVGIGDAENDHAFLAVTECSAAVANALESLKKRVDYVTVGESGQGVTELVALLLESDLRFLDPALRRRCAFGTRLDGSEVSVSPYGNDILVAGSSGGGKTTLASSFLEKLASQNYQFCIVDPEGDYLEAGDAAVILGDSERPPTVAEIMLVLSKPAQNVVINLVGVSLKERPAFFESLLHRIEELFVRTGRPHWFIVDEAHHVLPTGWKPPDPWLPAEGLGVMLITVEPGALPPAALRLADFIVATGAEPDRVIESFSDAVGEPRPAPWTPPAAQPNVGEATGWFWKTGQPPFRFRGYPPRKERQRHQRKYAKGELSPELSFYFRGPEQRLNLRAQNLSVFVQTAEGLDDETWLYHLRRGDIARWFRDVIKDAELAAEAEKFENDSAAAHESRSQVLLEIQKRYIVDA